MDGDNSNQPGASGHWQYKSNDVNGDSPGNQSDPADSADGKTDDRQMLHSDEYLPRTDSGETLPDPEKKITWSASEFIAHQKSAGWYGILVLTTILIAGVVFLITHDKISTFVILFVGVIFGVYAARKPRTVNFTVDRSGLTIGQHFYEYGKFRSFAMVQEGAFSSIVFMPLKRFMPLITVYYDPKDEDKIVDILSGRIPLDTHKLDVVEQFMRRIRF